MRIQIMKISKQKISHYLTRGVMFVLLCSLPIVMIFISKTGIIGHLHEGDVALKSIYATVDFSYSGPIDEEKTRQAKEEMMAKTWNVYNLRRLNLDLGLFSNLKQRLQEKTDKIQAVYDQVFSVDYFLDKKDLRQLSLENKDYISIWEPLRESYRDIPVVDIRPVAEARKEIEGALRDEFETKKEINIVLESISVELRPNIIFNIEQTAKKRAEAEGSISLIYKQISVKKNELIINKGQITSKSIINKLSALYASQSQNELISFNIGLSILMLVFIVISIAFLKIYYPHVYASNKELALLSLLFLLAIILGKIIELSPYNSFIIPVASFSMIYFMLTNNVAISFAFAAILSMVMGVSLSNNIGLLIVFFVGSIVGITAVSKVRRRSQILQAGLLIGGVHFISILGWGLFNNLQYEIVLEQASLGIVSGLLSAVIIMVILPILEAVFGLVTNITLLELSDFNQPLLKDMVLKAPGTYHHSLLVGNLSEAAAEAIGANSLLTRVGSYFHDIGKIDKAEYFSENQRERESKHDNLNPSMSKLVIVNHVKEGQELARKHKLKKPIIDFIGQHHGTSLVYYFYRRALEGHKESQEIKEEVFRYPGPKPQSKETAICLLADSVEAATRSIEEPTSPKIEDAVQKVINNKFIDGQLDECDLTLKDLEKIAKTFTHILTGIYHSRVVYPEKKNGSKYKESAKETPRNKRKSKENRRKDSF